jgi:xanthine dehydrogenase accessory factor
MKDLEIWQFALAKLKKKESIILLIVVESWGSSPGRVGFKMIVAKDELCGSIGGGVMEVDLVENAKEFLILNDKEAVEKFGHKLIFGTERVHRKNSANSSGMICSGKQRVIFLKLKQTDIETINLILNGINNNHQGILELTDNGLRFITFDMKEFDAYWNSLKGKAIFVSTFQDWGYSEKIGLKQNLYIIGGGHCALALSEIMSKMDFHITVFDDRPNLNTLEKNKFAHRVEIIESYEKIGDFIQSSKNSYIVVMTLGYKFDEIVIRQLFDKKFKYFGVLGSKAKMKTLLKSLEKEGFDKTKLAKIHTPIGLPINSHTPEEIAVSIAAEIIQIKNS